MPTTEYLIDVLNLTDWELLDKQLYALLNLELEEPQKENLSGLENFLSNLIYAAVRDGRYQDTQCEK